MDRININVSAVDYDRASKDIGAALGRLERMVHAEGEYRMTESEFAFGWHFFVVSVGMNLVEKLAEQMGDDYAS